MNQPHSATPVNEETTTRSQEITNVYFALLDAHLADIIAGRVTEMMEINQIADVLCVSHAHLTDSVKQTTGHHPCHFYDAKILEQAKNAGQARTFDR